MTHLPMMIASGLSFCACLWLFYTFIHIHPNRRSIPLKMILILGISDFIQAIASLLLIFAKFNLISCEIFQYIITSFTLYSFFWSSTLALFSAMGLSASRTAQNKMKKGFFGAIVVCTTISALLPMILLSSFTNNSVSNLESCSFNISSTKPIDLLFIQLGPYLVAICITIVSYAKVAFLLKKVSAEMVSHWMINPRYLIWYPISQLLLYLPYLVAIIANANGFRWSMLEIIWITCIHLSGFVNSIVYLKMRMQIKKFRKEKDADNLVSSNNAAPLLSEVKHDSQIVHLI